MSDYKYAALDLATRLNTFESSTTDVLARAEAFLTFLSGDSAGKVASSHGEKEAESD